MNISNLLEMITYDMTISYFKFGLIAVLVLIFSPLYDLVALL